MEAVTGTKWLPTVNTENSVKVLKVLQSTTKYYSTPETAILFYLGGKGVKRRVVSIYSSCGYLTPCKVLWVSFSGWKAAIFRLLIKDSKRE